MGMLLVSKSTFIMTKTIKSCVHIGYFIHSGVFVFLQNCLWVPGYFQFRVSTSRNNRKRTALTYSNKVRAQYMNLHYMYAHVKSRVCFVGKRAVTAKSLCTHVL